MIQIEADHSLTDARFWLSESSARYIRCISLRIRWHLVFQLLAVILFRVYSHKIASRRPERKNASTLRFQRSKATPPRDISSRDSNHPSKSSTMSAADRPPSEQDECPTEAATKPSPLSFSSSAPPEPDEQIIYPTGQALALIMLALYLAVFLVALVRHPLPLSPPSIEAFLPRADQNHRPTGPHHHRDRHPAHHGRLPLPRRHGLVRQCVPARPVRLPAALRPCLHLLLPQAGLPRRYRPLRARLRPVRSGALVRGLHRRPRLRGLGELGHLLGRHCYHGVYRAAGQEVDLSGAYRGDL